MIIFLRLRKSPQTPKKKSVKETPKYLKASIGIVYFYANSTPFLWIIYIIVERSIQRIWYYIVNYLGQSILRGRKLIYYIY